MQEISYFDSTVFRGLMEMEEESNIAYKEGPGKVKRAKQTSYYKSLSGNWSRGLFHGRKNTIKINLDVFPRDYLSAYPNAKSL
jgi:hypothetical protein